MNALGCARTLNPTFEMLTLSAATLASNPFPSNVHLLTPSNWSMLEQSPHLWMVNVCRQS